VAPTVAPTAEPTAEPPATIAPPPPPAPTSPPPRPVAPTRAPASPQAESANVTCALVGAAGLATPETVAEPGPWTLYDCELELAFGPVDSLTIQGDTGTPGWRLILTEPDAPNTPGLLDASNARLRLDDLDGETEATFLVGIQTSCTAFRAATIGLDITATRPGGGDTAVETTAEIPLSLPAEPLPSVTLDSLTVTSEPGATLARLELTYANAPTGCPWHIVITLDGAGPIAIDPLTGRNGLTAAAAAGLVTITVPPGEATGAIDLTLRLAADATLDTVLIDPVTFP